MFINGTNFTLEWERGSFSRHLLDGNILFIKAVVFENDLAGKWQLIMGDKVLYQNIIEGKTLSDTKDKIEEDIELKITEIMTQIGAIVPDIVLQLQEKLKVMEDKMSVLESTSEDQTELISECKEELADHEYRISVLEGVPTPINARRNPSGR